MAEHPFFIQRTSTLGVINGLGNGLKRIGINLFRLEAQSILENARKKAAFKGSIPGQVQEGLHQLIKSIQQEAHLNAFGELAAKSLFERTVFQRLKVEQHLQANPEIEKKNIKEPVFIIGMPRTGTTILHAMMHEDPQHRSPLTWECLLPHPVPQPDTFHHNKQKQKIAKELDQLFKLVPDFKQKHHLEVDAPQECLGINMLDFNSFQPMAQYYIPSYVSWFITHADQVATFQFHKRFLQYLESGGVRGRWLLKSPVHLMRLEALLHIYPDAKIIMTHRHPAHVVSSVASLVSSVRSLYSNQEDPLRTAKEQVDIWKIFFEKSLAARKRLNIEDQIIDIRFNDFVKDQMNVIQKIYERFDWTLSQEAESRMKKFLAENPKDKHGVHDHSLELFGLNAEDINRQYIQYIDFLNQLH